MQFKTLMWTQLPVLTSHCEGNQLKLGSLISNVISLKPFLERACWNLNLISKIDWTISPHCVFMSPSLLWWKVSSRGPSEPTTKPLYSSGAHLAAQSFCATIRLSLWRQTIFVCLFKSNGFKNLVEFADKRAQRTHFSGFIFSQSPHSTATESSSLFSRNIRTNYSAASNLPRLKTKHWFV